MVKVMTNGTAILELKEEDLITDVENAVFDLCVALFKGPVSFVIQINRQMTCFPYTQLRTECHTIGVLYADGGPESVILFVRPRSKMFSPIVLSRILLNARFGYFKPALVCGVICGGETIEEWSVGDAPNVKRFSIKIGWNLMDLHPFVIFFLVVARSNFNNSWAFLFMWEGQKRTGIKTFGGVDLHRDVPRWVHVRKLRECRRASFRAHTDSDYWIRYIFLLHNFDEIANPWGTNNTKSNDPKSFERKCFRDFPCSRVYLDAGSKVWKDDSAARFICCLFVSVLRVMGLWKYTWKAIEEHRIGFPLSLSSIWSMKESFQAMARLWDFRTSIRAAFSSFFKSFAIYDGQLVGTSKNAYSKETSSEIPISSDIDLDTLAAIAVIFSSRVFNLSLEGNGIDAFWLGLEALTGAFTGSEIDS
ncbi:hypothetical protein Tco_0246431 [Tanacetum coccineum]